MENEIQVIEPTALQAITEAEINQQVATAKRFPRVLSKVREKIFELATTDKAAFHDIVSEIYFFAGKDPETDIPNMDRYDGRNY